MDEHRTVATDDQVHRRHVFTEVVAQVAERVAHGFEFDAGVEQVLDGLELEQIAIGIAAPRTTALCVGQRRTHQVGARPVVELPVGDPDDGGRGFAAVAGLVVAALGRHRVASEMVTYHTKGITSV